jgi:hypothetical protein
MTDGDLTHVGGVLENIQTSVKVIAEGHLALVEGQGVIVKRLDRIDSRLDGLEMRFEAFASDAQQRLERIEGHLELDGSSRTSLRRKVTKASSPRHRKKA